jgi:hypothetical protein
MKVAELILELQKLDPQMEAVMSSDSEGNSYSPVAGVGEGLYVAENSYRGELYALDDADELDEDDVTERVACLWPTN